MGQKKKQNAVKEVRDNKLDLLKEVVVNIEKKEEEKQRQIYGAMKGIQVERKG